jgi:nitrate reductase delta subunit
MEPTVLWDRLAALFRYPGEDYLEVARRCHHAAAEMAPEAAPLLVSFLDRMRDLSTEARQELYTATFDLNPACAPEVGWHLFGENYERGAFLVKMRRQLARFGLPDAGELPDHLGPALAVLGRMPAEEAGEFAGACLLPALGKMRASLAGKDNPFDAVLEAVTLLVERRVAGPSVEEPQEPALPAGNGRGV